MLPNVRYREAEQSDIPAMARIRAGEWETEEYWRVRISRYLARELHPRHALMPRVIYVALEDDSLVGFIAGHLTRRHACDGELEWINVVPERRGSEIASELLRMLAAWFAEHEASRICVDVHPANATARGFYTRHNLNEHWLVWNDIKVVLARAVTWQYAQVGLAAFRHRELSFPAAISRPPCTPG
jgi:ribosomal protein S18 acetylase RimI-like enzyme